MSTWTNVSTLFCIISQPFPSRYYAVVRTKPRGGYADWSFMGMIVDRHNLRYPYSCGWILYAGRHVVYPRTTYLVDHTRLYSLTSLSSIEVLPGRSTNTQSLSCLMLSYHNIQPHWMSNRINGFHSKATGFTSCAMLFLERRTTLMTLIPLKSSIFWINLQRSFATHEWGLDTHRVSTWTYTFIHRWYKSG